MSRARAEQSVSGKCSVSRRQLSVRRQRQRPETRAQVHHHTTPDTPKRSTVAQKRCSSSFSGSRTLRMVVCGAHTYIVLLRSRGRSSVSRLFSYRETLHPLSMGC